MELQREEEVRFEACHLVSEKSLIHLEKGVRKLGFESGGKRMMHIFLGLALICLAARFLFQGVVGDALMVIGTLCTIVYGFGIYILLKAWHDAKKQIHLQFVGGNLEGKSRWTYRFGEDFYEVLGKSEKSRVSYQNVCRLIDLSGMYVLVERGNVVRYFYSQDIQKGSPEELLGFLQKKSGVMTEKTTVR